MVRTPSAPAHPPPAIPPQFPHLPPPRAQLSSYKDSAGHPALGEALFEAAEAGDMNAVQKILGEGTHPDDYVSPHGTTALLRAVETGQAKVVAALLEAGASPSVRNEMGEEPGEEYEEEEGEGEYDDDAEIEYDIDDDGEEYEGDELEFDLELDLGDDLGDDFSDDADNV